MYKFGESDVISAKFKKYVCTSPKQQVFTFDIKNS